jgi:trimeric autotransporter adhesin
MSSRRRPTRAERLAARRARTRRRVTRTGKLSTAAIVMLLTAVTGVFGWWTVGGAGAGNGHVGSLGAPTNVSGTVTSTTVHLTWTGVAPPGAGPFGYYVQRFTAVDGYTTASIPGGTCASSAVALLPASPTSCDESSVPSGTYKYRVTAVFRTWSASSALSGAVAVFLLDHFTVSAPASATAGAPFTVTVTAKDTANNTITNYAGTITFQSSDGQAALPADYPFVAGDNGVHTFSNAATLGTAGTQSLGVHDTVVTAAVGTASITVSPGPLDHFVVTTPATATAGVAFTSTTVSARDSYGNVASGWSSVSQCVSFSGATNAPDGTAPVYPAQGPCAAGQSQLTFNGSGTASGFAVTLFGAGANQLTVTASAKTGTSPTITVSAGAAAGLVFTSASNRNGAVTVTCTGPITALVCTPSADNGSGNGRFFTANMALVDAHQNLTTNTGPGAVTVALSQSGAASIAPASVTIAAGQSTSAASFTASLRNGSSATTITATATVNATSVTATVTTA